MSVGDVILAARKAKGWTQEELAEKSSVTQAAINRYEHAVRKPDVDVLERLATALGVTVRFIQAAGDFRGAVGVTAHMRRRLTEKPTVWRALEAKLNVYRMHAFLLFEQVSLRADNRFPAFDPIDTDPATAARFVRAQWRMPIGPVRGLTRWLESAGCLIIEEDFGTARVDGLSQWIDDHPVVLINLRAPTDRKRLTLAHEAGHLTLHASEATETMEREASMFAAEMLMPEDTIRPQLRGLTVGKLHDLKREWGVSMQAIIERAHELEMLSASSRQNLYKLLSHYGWRTKEPLSDEIPAEHPTLPGQIGDAMAQKGLSVDEIAEIAGFADADEDHPFRPSGEVGRGLRVVK